jgi:hypothetical protein
VGVGQLVLDDRDGGPVVVQRGRVLGRAQVRGRADELRVGRHRQDPADALQILRGHVLETLDQLAGGQVCPDLVFGPGGEFFNV